MDFAAVASETEAEVLAIMDSPDNDWKPSKTTDTFKLESKQSPFFDGHVYRSKFSLNGPFEECFQHLNIVPGSPRYKWDKDVNKSELKEQIHADTQIMWTVSNSLAMGLISPRDLIQLVKVKKTDDTMMFTAKSIEMEKYPPQDKFVRADGYPWGGRVVKDSTDPNKCHVTLVGEIDLKGRLPKSLVESSIPSLQVAMHKNYTSHLKSLGITKQ